MLSIKLLHLSKNYYCYVTKECSLKSAISLFSSISCRLSNIFPYKMSSLFVRSVESDDRLQITLDLADSNGTIKSFNLNRQKNEELKITVDRLRLNLSKKITQKNKKKKKGNEFDSTSCLEIPIEILLHGKSIELTTHNRDAWVNGAVLKVGEEMIPVNFNPPKVKLQNLPTVILQGFPLFPLVEIEFTDPNECEFYWQTFEAKDIDKIHQHVSKGQVDLSGAVKSFSYTPSEVDIGCYILLACQPKSGAINGKPEFVISSNPVQKGPGLCPFEKRQEHTIERAPLGSLRVVSYNILAQMYADTDLARLELFAHCHSHALDMDYRKHLLLKEIIGYNADLLCLQEVDSSIFNTHLSSALTALGYTGRFRPKAGQVSEGCAFFIRKDKFRVVRELDITLSEYLSTDPGCSDIWTQISQLQPLKEKIEQRSSILQVTVVESLETPGKFICVANTHLYFHPTACNIRLLHVAAAMRYLDNIRQAYLQEKKDIAVIFCGDFNSGPHLGVYQLITAQVVPADHVDFSSAGAEETLTSLELSQPINMVSACGTPEYTNFTKGFRETLDYIFVDADKLEVTKVIPMPSHEEVTANVALPSVVFPSDHIAQICELKFT